MGVSIGLTALLMILPGFSGAVGPGATYGRIPNGSPGDIWYKTNPQTGTRGLWSTVYTFDDMNTTSWTAGYTIMDLTYRDGSANPPASYVYYMNYMTFPWVAITWDDDGRTIYPFVDSSGSMTNQTRYCIDTNAYTDGNLNGNPAGPTNTHAQYNLDCNEDGTRDFTFEIEYILHVNAITKKGDIEMNIRETHHPNNWILDGRDITFLEFAFLVNPDVDDAQGNEVKWVANGSWLDVDEEGTFTTTKGLDCIKVINGQKEIIMKSMDDGQSILAWYVIKYNSAGQFSQHPGIYEDDEDIDGGDVEVWYIAGYSIPGNPPAGLTRMITWDIDP